MNARPFNSLPIYATATAAARAGTSSNSQPTTDSLTTRTTNSVPTASINGDPGTSQSPPTLICFRVLCHSSRIGFVIGKSGVVIKQLEQDTSAKIQVEDPPYGSGYRVITITADSSVNKTMSYGGEVEDQEKISECSEYREVSAAQEALVRVFEKIVRVAAEPGGYSMPEGLVSCRLLSDRYSAGSVIGKGGKMVEKIRNDTGCKIRVHGRVKLTSCALPTDELIEIEGDIVSIKKAIVAVSRRLQDCEDYSKTSMVSVRPHVALHREILARGNMLPRPWLLQYMPTSYGNHALAGYPPVSLDVDSIPSIGFQNSQREIVFRILCPSNRVGRVMGMSGMIIRNLQNQSGAYITVGPPSDCSERIITIASMESPELPSSPAQQAVILVFCRCVEVGFERGLESPLTGPVSARLLIECNQVGCLLGRNGSLIADMRKMTGTFIKIVGGHKTPVCAAETDHVVQITGELLSVRDALFSVTSRLRKHLFSKRTPCDPGTSGTNDQGNDHSHSAGTSFDQSNGHTTLTQSMDNLNISSNIDHPPPVLHQSQDGSGNLRSKQDAGGGSTSVKGGIELARGSKYAIVSGTMVEIIVSENVIGLVYGDEGSNLNRLRQVAITFVCTLSISIPTV